MITTAWVIEQGRALGFDNVGIAPAGDLPELAYLPEWLGRGYAGELPYMHNPKRRNARALLPDARSVICCALAYDTHHPRSTEVPLDPERGWLSRYAWGRDYHWVLEEKLEALRTALGQKAGAGFQARLYVDTGPILERVYGKHAGLGWIGKNTCLLDAEAGSFFFLGVLVTNLELAPGLPPPDACGACSLCLEACPTGALDPGRPYILDARRCISYLTIELRGAIPLELRASLGRHLFGCDICQDVCPYNRRTKQTDLAAFEPRTFETRSSRTGETSPITGTGSPIADRESLFHPSLEWLASLSEAEFQQVFQESPVKRAKWRGLVRNVLVAMGNSGNPRFRPVLEKFAAFPDGVLAEHAHWALSRLGASRASKPPGEAVRTHTGKTARRP